MNNPQSYYRKGALVAKIDSRIITDTTPWRKKEKYIVTEVIKVGEHGVYWVRPVSSKNPDFGTELQLGGYDVKDKTAYARWLVECEQQKLYNILKTD